MTRSSMLLDRVRKLALLGPDAGFPLAEASLELAKEYEIAVENALRIEAVVHRWAKESEKDSIST